MLRILAIQIPSQKKKAPTIPGWGLFAYYRTTELRPTQRSGSHQGSMP
jgi:hypothetical protein